MALENGDESANHMEQIAMDMGALLGWAFPQLAESAALLRSGGLVSRMRAGGRLIHEAFGADAWTLAIQSTSDTVRGWGAMAIGQPSGLSLEQRLELIRPFADDAHFAVREWAWLALRPHIAVDLQHAVRTLEPFTREPSERLRRYATEATRPRGVWSVHLPELKANPRLGLPLLAPLRADAARYVQDSVANWLNDASRTQPEWVRGLCRRWQAAGEPATARICRRAMRSLQNS